MRSVVLKSALAMTVLISWSGVPAAERAAALAGTNPDFKSIGPLAFSPDGVLFAGDTQSAAIFALDLGAAATGAAPSVERRILVEAALGELSVQHRSRTRRECRDLPRQPRPV